MTKDDLYQLIYISQARRPMAHDELMVIQGEAIARNSEVGVTGVLLYGGGKFMQLLEGPREVLAELFGRIALDMRHERTRLLHHGPTQTRLAPSWSMGLANADRPGAAMSIESLESCIRAYASGRSTADPATSLVHAFERMVHGFEGAQEASA